jgi:hypothetical protein
MTTETALTFREKMPGNFAMGATTPEEGAREGRLTDWRFVLHATVTVEDIRDFSTSPGRPARLTGEVELPGVRHRIPFTEGVFRLFPLRYEPRYEGDGSPLMAYEITFHRQGTPYHLAGRKSVPPRPVALAPLGLWADTTTLATRLYRGTGPDGEVVGAGVLRLGTGGLLRLLASVRTPWAAGPADSGQALGSYAWLFTRGLARTYFRAAAIGGTR